MPRKTARKSKKSSAKIADLRRKYKAAKAMWKAAGRALGSAEGFPQKGKKTRKKGKRHTARIRKGRKSFTWRG